jgi:hypothetical protein
MTEEQRVFPRTRAEKRKQSQQFHANRLIRSLKRKAEVTPVYVTVLSPMTKKSRAGNEYTNYKKLYYRIKP